MTATLPSVFVSHGAPTLPFEEIPARGFLEGLGRELGRPEAVLCVSAHWETTAPTLSLAAAPETIHDFFGFPEPLYQLRYPAPGAPGLARRAAALLAEAGPGADRGIEFSEARGLDHGAWVPLMLMYPEAEIPVTQLSIQTARGPAAHLALGEALAPLRQEGVLVLGSGGTVHNLREWRAGDATVPAWAQAFDDWLASRIEAGAADDLVDYRTLGPEGARAHPSEEHYLPLLVAAGAGGGRGRALHRSFAQGGLSMAAYAFG
ncbi:MAG: dioxygenase [Rhodospirillales bacterium]|nr:dioxygenase [Rhodospirillales bacterium]